MLYPTTFNGMFNFHSSFTELHSLKDNVIMWTLQTNSTNLAINKLHMFVLYLNYNDCTFIMMILAGSRNSLFTSDLYPVSAQNDDRERKLSDSVVGRRVALHCDLFMMVLHESEPSFPLILPGYTHRLQTTLLLTSHTHHAAYTWVTHYAYQGTHWCLLWTHSTCHVLCTVCSCEPGCGTVCTIARWMFM